MMEEGVITGFALINHAKHTDGSFRDFVYLNGSLIIICLSLADLQPGILSGPSFNL